MEKLVYEESMLWVSNDTFFRGHFYRICHVSHLNSEPGCAFAFHVKSGFLRNKLDFYIFL